MNHLESEILGIASHEIEHAGRRSHGIGHVSAQARFNQSQADGLVAGYDRLLGLLLEMTICTSINATELHRLVVALPGHLHIQLLHLWYMLFQNIFQDGPIYAHNLAVSAYYAAILHDRGGSRFLEDLGDGKAKAPMHCVVKFYLIGIVNHKGAILKTALVLLNSLLVKSYQDIDLVHVSGDLLSGSSDYREIMSSPDERGVVVVHVNVIAKTAKEASHS